MGRSKKFLDTNVIVDKALELIEAHGFFDFSTRKLARELNISAMTLYNYFENRDSIIKQAILKGLDVYWSGIPEGLEENARKSGNPLRVYIMFADSLIDFGIARPNLYIFLFNSDLASLKRDPSIDSKYTSLYKFVSGYALPGSDLEQIHSDLYMFLVLCNSLVLNAIHGRSGMTSDLFRQYIARTYELLVAPHEKSFVLPS